MVKDKALDIQDIKRRAVFGVVSLQIRSHLLQIIGAIGKFILTVLLDPAAWGVFAIVTAVINFLNYFQDIGLGAALIQKKEEPTRGELLTTFTIQQLLVSIGVVVLLLFSATIADFYRLDTAGLFLLRCLSISFFLSSLRTIPSILLERKLEFQKLVFPQVLESLVFYTVAITLSIRGFGIASYAWATLLRGIVGTIAIYYVSPWTPGFLLEMQTAKRLLSYGIPFQAPSFLALVKDDLLILFLGRVLPLSALGYITFAKQMSELMMRNVMDNVIRVTFPTFARLQHDKALLAKAIEKSMLFMFILVFPIAVGTIFAIAPFIHIVPKYIKWEPALFSFYAFTLSFVLATLSTPIYNALNALGKVKITLNLQIFWTVLTWVLVPLAINLWGFNGVAAAMLLINLTSFLPLLLIKRYAPVRIMPVIVKPLPAVLALVIIVGVATLGITNLQARLATGIIVGILGYAIIGYISLKDELLPYLKLLRSKA